MAGEGAAKPKWYTRPHISSWYALSAVLVGIFAVNACGYPFATVPSVAERYYPDVAPAAIRWQPVTVAAVSTIAVIFVLPAIRRFGIHVVVYASASFLLLGGVFRCLAMASPVQDGSTQGVTSYAMVHFGTAVMAVALAPFQVAGTLVSTTFPGEIACSYIAWCAVRTFCRRVGVQPHASRPHPVVWLHRGALPSSSGHARLGCTLTASYPL